MLTKYFDSDKDGFLNYQEFMQVLLPCDDMYLRSAATQRPNYPISPTAYLAPSVEKDLTELFEREIKWHTKSESRKHDLMRRYDWTNSTAFNSIDVLRHGQIEHRDVSEFLKKNGHYATESELIAIIRRLDVDADQKITYDEWCDAIRPINPPAHSSSSLAPPSSSSSHLSASRSSPLRSRGNEEESKASPSRGGLGSSYGASPSRGGTASSGFQGASPSRGGTSSSYGAGAYSSPARSGAGAKKRDSPLK